MQFFLTGKVIENDSPEHNGREINDESGDNDLGIASMLPTCMGGF